MAQFGGEEYINACAGLLSVSFTSGSLTLALERKRKATLFKRSPLAVEH